MKEKSKNRNQRWNLKRRRDWFRRESLEICLVKTLLVYEGLKWMIEEKIRDAALEIGGVV